MISRKEDSLQVPALTNEVTWPTTTLSRLPRDLLPPITFVELYFAALFRT